MLLNADSALYLSLSVRLAAGGRGEVVEGTESPWVWVGCVGGWADGSVFTAGGVVRCVCECVYGRRGCVCVFGSVVENVPLYVH